jgi:hypothetical protein
MLNANQSTQPALVSAETTIEDLGEEVEKKPETPGTKSRKKASTV